MLALIVDDDLVSSERAAFALEEIGIRCHTAQSADQALEMSKTNEYGIFLLDIHLGGLSGIELCRVIKMKCDSAVMFGSNDSTEAAKVMCFEAGADDFMAKPISTYELICRVRAVLRRCGR